MHFTSSKTRKCGHSLIKVAITSAMASSQVIEWCFQWIEGLHLKDSVPIPVGYPPLKSPSNDETGLVVSRCLCVTIQL